MEVLWSPTLTAPSNRRSTETLGGLPRRVAISAVSCIMASTKSRVPGWAAIWPMVALVRTLIGLNATLPMSLSQMSLRRLVSTGHLRPPATIAALNAAQRSETVPSGSPIEYRVPSMRRITPGGSISAEEYTTAPRGRGAAGVRRLHTPSLIGTGEPVEVPPRDSVLRCHHAGVARQQRSDERAGVGVAVSLEPEEHDVDRADLGGVVGGVRVGLEVPARAQDGDALAPHDLQVLAARNEVHVSAAPVERGTDVRADGAGADDRDLHPSTSAARLRRCTLPVGPFGISARIVTRAGRLNGASRSRQCAASLAGVASPRRTTTTPTCSPYFSSGTGYAAASATAGWDSSTSSISYGEIFLPGPVMSFFTPATTGL